MKTLTIHSNVGDDAKLTLRLPRGFKNRAVKVVLETESKHVGADEPRDANGWPIGFFEETAGKWHGEFERGAQGEYEVREMFQ